MAIAANSLWHVTNFRWGLIEALAARGYAPLVIAPPDRGFETPRDERIAWAEIKLSRSGRNPFYDLRLIGRIRRILRTTRPAALLSFTIKPNIYGCIAARMSGVPAIPNITGLGTVFVQGGALMRLVVAMYRVALARAPTVFFQNREDLDFFVGRGIVRAERARLLPGSGVDLEQFKQTAIPLGPLKFLLMARLLSDKGVREFAGAARLLKARGLDARFQLLGPIDKENPTAIREDELAGWAAEGLIDYLGETRDVRPYLEAASVVVLPSYYREGVPRSLLEGAASGRPIITTTNPGCRDVVEDGVNGYLCEPRSAESLADAMERMIKLADGNRAAMGARSRRLAEQRFDEKLVIAEYLRVLEDLGVRPSGIRRRDPVLDGMTRDP